LLQTVDAGNTILHLEYRPDLFDIQLVKVSRFDLTKQNVFDLAGAEGRLSCHTEVRNQAAIGRGGACEKYHKQRFMQGARSPTIVCVPRRRAFGSRRILLMPSHPCLAAIFAPWLEE